MNFEDVVKTGLDLPAGDGRKARNARRRWLPAVIIGAIGLTAGLVFVIGRSESLPHGPQPVIWDKTPCAECRMAVSERRFAAQLQTGDGEILDFDDSGCLVRFLEDHEPVVHAIYFHHLREERWLTAAEVAFVEARPSPMAFNLGAVDRGTPGALTFDDVRVKLRRRGQGSDHAPE
jgi:hypothetical protein